MRGNDKSALARLLISDQSILSGRDVNYETDGVVMDGGALLHKVLWKKGSTFSSIFKIYIRKILNFTLSKCSDIMVIFDGYISSTKDHCHLKRNPISGAEVRFDKATHLLCSKEVLLSNTNNKERFIDHLSSYM